MESIKTWIQILNDNYPISIVGNKTLFLEEDLEEVKKNGEKQFSGNRLLSSCRFSWT